MNDRSSRWFSILILVALLAGLIPAPTYASPIQSTLAAGDTTAPTVPASLRLSTTTPNRTYTSVRLAWNAATDNVGVTGYQVFRDGTYVTTINSLELLVGGLFPGRWYSFTVRSQDAAGNVSALSTAFETYALDDTTPPSTPGSLRLGATPNRTVTSIALAWNASTDNDRVASYHIYRNNTFLMTVAAPATTANITGLTPNTTYSFTVQATDVKGNGSTLSNVLSATTLADTTAPSAPASLRTTSSTVNSIALAWNASTDNVAVTGYEVFRDGVLAGTPTGTSYTVTGLTQGTSFSFTVKAKDGAGNRSAASAPLNASTLADPNAPDAPSNLRLSSTAPNRTDSTIALEWNTSPNFDVIAYDIYRGTTLAGTTSGTASSFTATGLAVNTTYSFTVKARNDNGVSSDASNTLSATTLVDTTPPSAPANLVMQSRTDGAITIGWSASTDNVGVSGYDVYKNGALLATVTGLSHTATGLTPSTAYAFTVKAKDALGNTSAASAVLNAATTADVTPPSVPQWSGGSRSMSWIRLSWTASTDNVVVTGYHVYEDGMLIGTTTATEFTHTGLCAYCEYYYTVTAFDAAGNESAPNQEVREVTDPSDMTPPTAPAGLVSTAKDAQSVTLQWGASSDNEGVTGYDIYRNGVMAGSSTTPNYTVTGLHALTSYSFTVKARDAAGNVSAASAALSVTTLADTTPPTAPTALAAPAKTDISVSLQWTASTDYEGVTGYDIYRDGALAGSSTTPNYTVTGLQPSTAYSFTVKARDAAGNVSPASSALVVTTLAPIVSLHASISPTTVYAGEPILSLVVEARDSSGALVPDYRGSIYINPNLGVMNLVQAPWPEYDFTAADAGRHVFENWGFTQAGQGTITVIDAGDSSRQAVSNAVTVREVSLSAAITPTTVHASVPTLSLVVEARDSNGALVPGYRGSIYINPNLGVMNLVQAPWPEHDFTAADAGRHVFENWGFTQAGQGTITVIDAGDSSRQAVSNAVTVREVYLSAAITPSTAVASVPNLSLVVEARDSDGALVTGYRSSIDITGSTTFMGLPQAPWPDYDFTVADAGRHVFENWAFGGAGAHTITVIDSANIARRATSNTVQVSDIILSATISPSSAAAGEQSLVMTVEARDSNGNLVPEYRGALDVNPASSVSGLYQSTNGWLEDYTFTAADAGRHTFSGWGFNVSGSHTVTIVDRAYPSRQATSNAVTIGEVHFVASISPDHSHPRDKDLTLVIEVRDDQGELVPGYRGAIDINPSTGVQNIYQSPLQGADDFTFSASNAGRAVFPNFAFTTLGEHSITVIDRGNGTRQTTTNMVSVTTPPDPMPIPAGTAPGTFTVPESVTLPPAIPYGWAAPIQAVDWLFGTQWKGYPEGIVPSGPGSRYVVSGVAMKDFESWWAGTFYTCAYLGWENPPTAQRENAYGTGYLPHQDPTFTAGAMDDQNQATSTGWCGGWDGPFSELLVATLGPALSDPAGLTAQAAHINIQNGSGNAEGFFQLNATPLEDTGCDGNNGGEPIAMADPISSRDGSFSYTEHDLGVATGCTNVSLKFERFYNQYHASSTIFSPGWTHTFDQRILTYGSDVLVQRPGGYTPFKDVGGNVYAGVPGSRQVLMKRPGGGWVLLHRDRRADLFDSQGRLEAQQDPNGNMIWMTYENYSREDLSGSRLARVDAPGGRYLWFGYDYYQPGQMIVVGDNAGRAVRFSYDDHGRLAAVKDALNHTSTYTYEGNHWLLKTKTDANGHPVFTNGFDQSGRVITQTNNLGQSVDLSYAVISDTNGLMGTTNSAGTGVPYPALLLTTVMTDQTGLVTTFVYGSDGLLRKVSDSTGKTTQYRNYTETRKPGEVDHGGGHITTYRYNALGLPTQVTNALGDSTFATYNTWGQATLITDTLGHQVDMTYVGPNLVDITGNGGRSVQIDYQDQAGWKQMISSISESGALTTTLTYDAKGDITAITDADGRSMRLDYDAVGRPINLVDPVGFTTTLEYDAQDRMLELTEWTGDAQAPARTSSFAYDAVGNVLTTTNPLEQVTSYRYDPLNRLVEQTLADTSVIGFRYDDQTTTLGLTPPGQPEHTLSANPLLGQYVPPALGNAQVSTSYTYNLLNQLVGVERPDGLDLSVQYDVLGRTTAITQPNGVLSVTYDHRSGLPATLTAPDSGLLTIGYDANALPITTTWSGAIVGSVYQTFDIHGQVTRQTVNSQQAVPFVYDRSGTLRQAGALSLGYQSATGLLTGTSLAATSDVWTYDAFGEPTAYQADYDQDALLTLGLEYDAVGAIITRTETLDGVASTYHYEYDEIGQLTTVFRNGTAIAGYTYDDNGNRLTTTTGQGVVSASYDDQDRLLQWGATSYDYTLNGEVTTKTGPNGSTQYIYDVMGNLQSVTLPDSTVITYLHDALNRRIGKKINGTLVQGWLYADGLMPIAELNGSGAVVSQFVYASQSTIPDYLIRGSQTYRIIADHVGSPRLIVNASTGEIVQRLDYDTWGMVTTDTNPGFQPFGFAGGLYDPLTSLTRFGARDYDAATGRWTAKDPIGFNGGDTNLYRYVGNNPINFVDPTGQSARSKMVRRAVQGAVLGALGSLAGQMLGNLLHGRKPLECINWKNVILGAGFGAAAGVASALPIFGGVSETATAVQIHQATVRTMLTNAGFNGLQYWATMYYNGEAFDPASLLISLVGGFVAGRVSGPTTRPDLDALNMLGSNRPIMVDMAWDNLPKASGDTMRAAFAVPPAYLPGYSPPACTCN